MKWFSKQWKLSSVNAAFAIDDTRLHLAVSDQRGSDAKKIKALYTMDGFDPQQAAAQISALAYEFQLQEAGFYWLLNEENYRLLLIKRPPVEDSELKSAAKWQIKEMINYPLSDAAIDVFTPSASIATQKGMLFVVVARQSFLQKITNAMHQAKLQLISIGIPEFALCNILHHISSPQQLQAILHIGVRSTLLVVAKDGELLFSRRIQVNGQDFMQAHQPLNLAVELNRSLGYFSTSLRQVAPEKLWLCPTMPAIESTVQKNLESANIHCEIIDVTTQLNTKKPFAARQLAECFICLGEALSNEGRA